MRLPSDPGLSDVLAVDSFAAGVAAFIILLGATVGAGTVILRALRSLAHAIRELDRRIQKLHDLTDPNGNHHHDPPGSVPGSSG